MQVEAGADVTLKDSQGATALTFAAEAAHVEAVRLRLPTTNQPRQQPVWLGDR